LKKLDETLPAQAISNRASQEGATAYLNRMASELLN